jgi:hypothetical protein
MNIADILPMPLCEKHLEYVMKEIMACPECQGKLKDFISLPIVGNSIPPIVKEGILKLIPGGKSNGKIPS